MEVSINGHEYSIGKLSAFDQFHVARRLAPLLAAAAGGLGPNGKPAAEELDPSAILAALSAIKDEDVEFIFNTCLKAAERRQSGAWAKVRRDGTTMFELSLPELLQVCAKVFEVNLGNFTSGLPSLSVLEGMLKAKA